ncbi:Major facilitator superfamily protein [Spironucleus salmonicida]|uniref:Lysosomal dipeptide transporter MFSD1 n=1 Tax=Spironucleus salmonicida TaxID=348837 RepID=V6LY46_9EUKA|nr:Major facilitator superfamily protein [Spironucleus salmonicida]|eukprot:EST45709.1 Major facilitator superfamily protein [Spironucleus salmonicida]
MKQKQKAPKSRRLEMMESVQKMQVKHYKRANISSRMSNQSRMSHQTNFTSKTQVTLRTNHVPVFANERQISKQIPKNEESVESSGFEILCCFIAGTLASFSGLYIGDSIAAQQTYIQPLMGVDDSQIGFLASCIFLGSLFMPLVCAPFIDKYGPIKCGIFMNIYNVILCIPMPFFYRNYNALLGIRLIAGAFPEATFSVQSAMVVKYLPKRLESLGFGICMSVATSANLISFFIIPALMDELMYDSTQADDAVTNVQFISVLKTTYWMNVYVSLASLMVFILTCIPLLKIDKKIEMKKLEELKQNQSENKDDSMNFDDFEDNEVNQILTAHIEEQLINNQSKKHIQDVMSQLQPLKQRIPNNFSIMYFAKKVFFLPLDYWLICSAFCLLLSCCYGAQTLIITYLNNHISYADTAGIVRSVASILGGPICGAFVSWIGQRPLLNIIFFALAIVSFALLFLSQSLPSYIPAFFIGFFDGSSATVGKSLFSYVVEPSQLNNAYAFGGIMLNIGQFAFPPVAGALSLINVPDESAGIIWFYIIMLIVGMGISIVVFIRDKRYFNGVLSKVPEI